MRFVIKTTQKFLILFAALFISLFFSESSQACSCVRSPTVDIAYEQTPNVAILKLRSVEKYSEGEKGYGYGAIKQSKLTVEKVFKGNLKVGQELTFTQGSGGDCIWTFSEEGVGAEFLFYLDAKLVENNILAASTCSRSHLVKFAAKDLLYFEKMSKVRGKTRLSGTLTQSIPASVESEESFYNRLAGRKVRIIGNGKDNELKTDENGVFEIYDLPAGKYKIIPEQITGYKISWGGKDGSVEVEIKSQKHTELDFQFSIDNRINGRLFDANGKPLKDVCLDLLPARGKKPRYFYEADCTDENGRFEIDEIPAGTYIIVVNDDGKITSREPFGTFYYPSAKRREDAAEITIGAGDFLENLIINAPETAETVTVSGVLLFENGKTANKENAEFASVEFVAEKHSKQSGDSDQEDARAEIDEKGRFSIRILKGQKGRLFGSLMTYEGQYVNCPKLDKLIRQKGSSIKDIETPSIEIEATNDLIGMELKFPFPSCKKAKID